MIILFTIVMALLLIVGLAIGGVIVPLAIAWLVAAAPITLGIIHYNFYYGVDIAYELTLTSYVLAFVLGVVITRLVIFPNMRPLARQDDSYRELQRLNSSMKFCWWVGMFGSACLLADFFISRGGSLGDFAALRSDYAMKVSSSTIFGKLATVAAWACLYCFFLLFYYWEVMKRKTRLYMFAPVFGYFLTSLLSAGRQAAFQIVIAVALIMCYRLTPKKSQKGRMGGIIFAVLISGALIAYMGFIAVVRNDGMISTDKRDVLRLLFDYRIPDDLRYIETLLGPNLSAFIEEFLTYFTAQTVLFRSFLEVGAKEMYLGVFDFPFFHRQIEGLTGVSVIGALYDKTIAMERAGVISAGWTTAISSYIQDFGRYGSYLFMAVLGGYSEYTWKKARMTRDFHDFVIMILMMMSAVYMPMFPASSDTNLFLLWLYCFAVRYLPAFRLASRKPTSPRPRSRNRMTPQLSPGGPPVPFQLEQPRPRESFTDGRVPMSRVPPNLPV